MLEEEGAVEEEKKVGEAWQEGAGRNEIVTPAEGYKGSGNRFVCFFRPSPRRTDGRREVTGVRH